MYTEFDRNKWGWDEYEAYANVGYCYENEDENEEYADYEYDNQPNWYKYVEYDDDNDGEEAEL